jgi:hypothetical protein
MHIFISVGLIIAGIVVGAIGDHKHNKTLDKLPKKPQPKNDVVVKNTPKNDVVVKNTPKKAVVSEKND